MRARVASPVPLAAGMRAFWPGDDEATDLIGAHDGNFYSKTTGNETAPQVTVNGKVGGAFDFDGTTYVQVTYSPQLTPLEMTAEAWVSPTMFTPGGFNAIIASGWQPVATTRGTSA